MGERGTQIRNAVLRFISTTHPRSLKRGSAGFYLIRPGDFHCPR